LNRRSTANRVQTRVAVLGAGPAGLLLGRMLDQQGIDNVILESRSREYVERRQRAGLLEQGTVDFIAELGVDERLRREGLIHGGVELRFGGQAHRIAMDELTGGLTVTIYAQTEIVKDLIAARLEGGGELRFEADATSIEGLHGERPVVHGRDADGEFELSCELVAACDGFHGIGRPAMPAGVLHSAERSYPYAWLGILVQAPPSCEELIYCHSERGFALHSMRSTEISRLYLQVPAEERIEDWSDDRIWEELHLRLAQDGWSLTEGYILEKGITPMRSFVAWPMQHGRLYLAGDAAHIVPPTGAKGLNLAARDVRVLGEAIVASLREGDDSLLAAYSDACLGHVWRAQDFSFWMTSALHLDPGDSDGFGRRLQLARLANVCSSEAAARTFAEGYVGADRARVAT
jgi:p-hydroxybenzoate 3-monooxygenase